MNLNWNDCSRETNAQGKSGTLVLLAVAVVACAGVIAAFAFKSTAAKPVAVAAVQGSLLDVPTSSNVAPAVATTPQPPSVSASGTPAPSSVTAPQSGKQDDYLTIGFDKLAGFPVRLKWQLVDAVRIKGEQRMMDDVPANIKQLDNSRIAVKGFMLPLKLEDGLVTDFLLMRTQARCCYGLPIQVNELLSVHMTKSGVKSLMDVPVTIYGTLHLDPNHDNTGALTSIYAMDGDKMVVPEGM